MYQISREAMHEKTYDFVTSEDVFKMAENTHIWHLYPLATFDLQLGETYKRVGVFLWNPFVKNYTPKRRKKAFLSQKI